MKPKIYDVNFLKEEELNVGDELLLLDELQANTKFKSFLVGTAQLPNGEKRLLSLNKSSYLLISNVFGEDTINWINYKVRYCGIKKMGNMQGKLFEAVQG